MMDDDAKHRFRGVSIKGRAYWAGPFENDYAIQVAYDLDRARRDEACAASIWGTRGAPRPMGTAPP